MPGDPTSRLRDRPIWSVTAPDSAREQDPAEGVIRWILKRFEVKGEILAELAENYDVEIGWWGSTDHWENVVRIPVMCQIDPNSSAGLRPVSWRRVRTRASKPRN
jgi:hypothetical protein